MSPSTHQSAPERLGDFEILREIARGGMGIVYEARQISLNRRVALKVMNSGLGLTTKTISRFHREAEAAARLHHTNIVPIYATGEDDGVHFYAMELIEGPSLDNVLRFLSRAEESKPGDVPEWLGQTIDYVHDAQTQLSDSARSSGSGSSSGLSGGGSYFDRVATMIADVADALEHAHNSGVIHRDIKPSNLLLSENGRLSISDFGLARVVEQPGMTVTGEFVGTPKYVSPEQITVGLVPIDHRTDVYSLGATLYELLTFQSAFSGERRDQLLAQILQKDPTPPRRLNKKVPVDLETICLKAMEKDPDRRYRSAADMAADLRRSVNRFAILARRAGPITKSIKWLRRHPALAASLLVGAIALTAAGALGYRAYKSELNRIADREAHRKKIADREARERSLIEDMRRQALDKAILAARQDDFEAAEAAIHEAEELGSSPGWLCMLRGQVAFYKGEMDRAVRELRKATTLLPNSVAAWSMLCVVNNNAGGPTKSDEALARALELTAETPEDFLFRGYAESSLDPERALQTLNEAVRRRPSVLARLIRAEVIKANLMNNPSVTQAKTAMKDVALIKQLMDDNAFVLGVSVEVHLTCYNAFDALNEPALRQTALAEGRKDAEALKKFRNLSSSVFSRWRFRQRVGETEAVLADLRKLAESPNQPVAKCLYGCALYERGLYQQAAETMAEHNNVVVLKISHAFALAERPKDGLQKAKQVYIEIAAKNPGGWDLFNSQCLLRFLGDKQKAVDVCKRLLKRPELFPPLKQKSFRQFLRYCAEDVSEEQMLSSMGGRRGELCNAHFCIALTALADGDRLRAKKHFGLSVDTQYFIYAPYDLSRMLLKRMESDPMWPPWIPQKKQAEPANRRPEP